MQMNNSPMSCAVYNWTLLCQSCCNDVAIKSTDTTYTHTQDSIMLHSSHSPVVHCIHQNPNNRRLKTLQLMHKAYTQGIPIHQTLHLHIDGGANRSITNNIHYLINFKNIKTYCMSSAGGENDIACTGLGYLPWQPTDGQLILIKCYYSHNTSDTIVSPTDIVLSHLSAFNTWTQHANM